MYILVEFSDLSKQQYWMIFYELPRRNLSVLSVVCNIGWDIVKNRRFKIGGTKLH